MSNVIELARLSDKPRVQYLLKRYERIERRIDTSVYGSNEWRRLMTMSSDVLHKINMEL